jgi:AcrR family transcriptional regulator
MRRIRRVRYSHWHAPMSRRKKTLITPRKQPQQARSAELVASALQAAVQVLAKQGARRFTMARVAERAGVSVGSLYQYFPNKGAILFRLQSEEWRQTAELLRRILENAEVPPLDRLRSLVHAFIRSECDEAEMRVALSDAAPLYRNAPEAKEARLSGARTFRLFIEQVLPKAPAAERAMAGELIMTTLSTVGKQFSERPHRPAEIDAFSGAMADMFCAYLRDRDRDPRSSARSADD